MDDVATQYVENLKLKLEKEIIKNKYLALANKLLGEKK